jgi:hypothetical protein
MTTDPKDELARRRRKKRLAAARAQRQMRDLLDRSSLGTPAAKATRELGAGLLRGETPPDSRR